MSKEFIPYEIALALKELGFDEPCLMVYNYKKQITLQNKIPFEQRTNQPNPYLCTAPLYQQAFRWFREEYGFYCPISLRNTFKIMRDNGEFGSIHYESDRIRKYQQAQDACLRKLIEIVNQNKDE